MEELLQEGVDVNSIDLDGRTALHIAACEGHLEVVRLLVQWRANIDARDRWGSTVRSIFGLLSFLSINLDDENLCLVFKNKRRCSISYLFE